MVEGEVSYGSWSFKVGPTRMTYEGGFILIQHDGDVDKKSKHGTGIMTWEDGREYRGEFAHDKMHGEGSMSWPTGEKYVGNYCENLKSGLGKLTLPDGSSFEGHWYNGKRHGDFLYVDPILGAFCMEYEMDQVLRSESINLSTDGLTLKPGYDVFIYSEAKTRGLEETEAEDSEPVCCICLTEFHEGDTCCRVSCQHEFHKECMDNWARRKNTCPLCLQKIPAHKFVESTELDLTQICIGI